MAVLPEDRLEPAPPFTYSSVDFFGPWIIRESRQELTWYGVLFTCMTSSFINALRRFISRRGPIKQLRCNRGTNFVEEKSELQEALSSMAQPHVQQFLLERNCDWIEVSFNVPSASHMGGVWERKIRTARNLISYPKPLTKRPWERGWLSRPS